jgi:peptidyl-prolyl cis-trans isomerase D
MLKQLGRLERTRSVIIIGFAVIMAVSLVIFYAPGRTTRDLEPTKSNEVLAKVDGDEVTVGDLARLRENYQQYFGGQISLAQLGGNKRFLDGLIRDQVMAQEAVRLGLAASDAEVADRLRKQFTDASGQFIGLDRYRDSVTARYGSIEKFERGLRDSIAQEKLRAFVTASVSVSDEEVQEDYKRKNTTFGVTYAALSANKLAEKIQPSDEELRNYYEQHKTDYRILEPQKKIRYIFISQEKIGEKIQIPEKDLHDEYDRLSPENKQSGVKVQQILLKVAREDLDNQVEQKAKDLVAKARGTTGKASEEVFAELARGNSEDPATAKSKGFLPRPVKKDPNKPDELYDRVIDLQPGELTDPIKHAGNWYILRRGEAVPKTFAEAKQELVVSLRNRRAYAAAAKLAERGEKSLKEKKDPQKIAQELASEANMKSADMVRETPYIKPGDNVPEIGSSQQFEKAIAPLHDPNDVGDRTGVKGGFAIPMLVDKKEPRIPDFAEVKDKVVQAVKQDRAKSQLEPKAREIASAANSANDLKAAAQKAGFEAKTEESYKLGSPLGEAGTGPALDEVIYGLKESEVTKTPLKIGDNWVIAGVTKRKEADLAEFAKQRDQLTQTMQSQRQSQVFNDYIGALTERMKRDGKIKIYQEVFDRLEEDEPVAAPPTRPRMPFPTK